MNTRQVVETKFRNQMTKINQFKVIHKEPGRIGIYIQLPTPCIEMSMSREQYQFQVKFDVLSILYNNEFYGFTLYTNKKEIIPTKSVFGNYLLRISRPGYFVLSSPRVKTNLKKLLANQILAKIEPEFL